MATKADVVAGSLWKLGIGHSVAEEYWNTEVGITAVIDDYLASGLFKGGTVNTICIDALLANAELIPQKCSPGCGPAAPCLDVGMCPGLRELACKDSDWYKRQSHCGVEARALLPGTGEPTEPPVAFRSGSGALACDWIAREERPPAKRPVRR